MEHPWRVQTENKMLGRRSKPHKNMLGKEKCINLTHKIFYCNNESKLERKNSPKKE
jgi:hypothetical protein